jgi:polyphosphate kinase
VEIDLIVRGVCCLRPGIPGISENIRVRSIIGRFLEHPRVYCFGNDGQPELFCSSADWMERNFFRRVEVAFPILDTGIRERLLSDLDLYLRDDRQAWQLGPDGRYARVSAIGAGVVSAQQQLLERYMGPAALSP